MANPLEQFFEGFGTGDILTTLASSAVWILILLVVIVFGGFMFWYIVFKRAKYDIIAKIYAERADGRYKIMMTKAAKKYKRKEGIWQLLIKGFKKQWPLPDSKYFETTTKNKDMIYILYKDGEMFPMIPPRMKEDNVLDDLKTIPYDIQLWNMSRAEQISATFKSFKDKLLQLLPYLLLVVTMVIFLVIIMQIMEQFTNVMPTLASEMRAAAEALQGCRAITVPTS